MSPASWCLVQDGVSLDTLRAYEGLFTVGSGYLHTRASLEEHVADCPQNGKVLRKPANVTAESFGDAPSKWGTYVPGIFGEHPLLLQEMINLPWFLGLAPVIEGERLDLTLSKVTECRRELNLKTATLSRAMLWDVPSGKRISLCFERFISGARPWLSVQRLILSCREPVAAEVVAGIDADVTTNGFDHFREVVFAAAGPTGLACRVTTDNGDTVAMRTVLQASAPPLASATDPTWGERVGQVAQTFAVVPGTPLVIEKRTAVATSRDLEPSTAAERLSAAAALSWEDLHAEHCAHWARAWEASDVVIEGDEASQLILRASIYHLLRAHVPGDSRVAIGAKGYAGEAYKGHFFWDTELYLLPFYLYTQPEKAKTLVDFRIGCLSEAKRSAEQDGYRGARYPWESDANGRRCCSDWQYRDHEIHVTADVVYGLAHYCRGVGQPIEGDAARVVVETARYWLARMDHRPGDDHPSILGVMGPDEYAPLSDDNAYTNRLAAFNLSLAAEVGASVGATEAEIAAFAAAAAQLPILRSQRDPRLVLQCEGFERLAEPRFDEFWKDRKGCYATHVSQERLYRSKNLKQADVLMLMALIPEEFSDDEVQTAWDYYLPVTTHDSSLSAGIHAIVAQRLGRQTDAWDFFRRSAAIDVDTDHGGAAQGIHIAGCGANWQVVVGGFAGFRTALQSRTLSLAPALPAHWTRLAFPLVWQGTPVRIDITPSQCCITNHGNHPIEVTVHGAVWQLAPGQTETAHMHLAPSTSPRKGTVK